MKFKIIVIIIVLLLSACGSESGKTSSSHYVEPTPFLDIGDYDYGDITVTVAP